MKFVEVHQPPLKHSWLQDIKLSDSNCLTTWPKSLLVYRVVKQAVRNDGSSFAAKAAKSVIPSRKVKSEKKKKINAHHALTRVSGDCGVSSNASPFLN